MFYTDDLLIDYLNDTFLGGEIDTEEKCIISYGVNDNRIWIKYGESEKDICFDSDMKIKEVEVLDIVGWDYSKVKKN